MSRKTRQKKKKVKREALWVKNAVKDQAAILEVHVSPAYEKFADANRWAAARSFTITFTTFPRMNEYLQELIREYERRYRADRV